jgi:hypothetical protein
MGKRELSKELPHLYRPSTSDFQVVEVPAMQFLMIDGHGDPNSAAEYAQAVEALYAVAYRAKFISKDELGRDYVVPPLEGLWWSHDMDVFTVARDKRAWDWTMLIMQPAWITAELFQRALHDVQRKRREPLPGLAKLRLAGYHEGLCAHILYTGSYDDEGPLLARLHQEWIPQHGYVENGKHHEIYLSDPRRVAASRLKTVLRQPIRPA